MKKHLKSFEAFSEDPITKLSNELDIELEEGSDFIYSADIIIRDNAQLSIWIKLERDLNIEVGVEDTVNESYKSKTTDILKKFLMRFCRKYDREFIDFSNESVEDSILLRSYVLVHYIVDVGL